MKLLGLGGGIGAGKSTVSKSLSQRGARIVDADLIAREVVEPGKVALSEIQAKFGDSVIKADGTLDRAGLASIVFSDPEALAALNKITHPRIAAEIDRQIAEAVGTADVVILDAALLFDSNNRKLQARIVVDLDPEVAVQRLVAYRGFSEADARARISSQMSRQDRVAAADFVVDNSAGDVELASEVSKLWDWIQALPEISPDPNPASK